MLAPQVTTNSARALFTGSTRLAVGTVADGEFLKRSGATIISAVPPDTTGGLLVTAVKTANYTASAGELVLCDVATTGSFTVTFPVAPAANDVIGTMLVTGSGSNTVTNSGNGKTLNGNHDNKLYIQGDAIFYLYTGTAWQTIYETLMPHSAHMTREAAQSILTVTQTKIDFDTVQHDYGQIADATTNNRFDIRRPGRYRVEWVWATGPVMDDGEGTTSSLHIDGIRYVYGRSVSPNANNAVTAGGALTIDLSASQYLEFYILHDEGATISTPTNGDDVPRMIVTEER